MDFEHRKSIAVHMRLNQYRVCLLYVWVRMWLCVWFSREMEFYDWPKHEWQHKAKVDKTDNGFNIFELKQTMSRPTIDA